MLRHTVLAAAVLGVVTSARSSIANPLFNGADPDLAVIGNTYWMYPTAEDDGDGGTFHAHSSPDLKTWTDRGGIFALNDARWIRDDGRRHHGAWAPGILQSGGKFYLYYAVGPQTPTKPSRIGVAVSEKPEGPFVDSGRPLVNDGGHGFEAIDPMAFTDPASGHTYLYAGGSSGATLRVWELADDETKIKREIKVATPPQFTEGSFMHVRDGVYYLSYSHGSYNNADYSVHYCTAPSPTGPWTYKGCILKSDATHKGPGHHAFFRNPSTGEWFIVYHRWETTSDKGPYHGHRKIAIEKLEYAADGTIEPVKMTETGPPASPITGDKPDAGHR